MFTKLPVYDSTYRWATLPKTIQPRMETMTETANKMNLAWRHIIIEVVGSIHTLCIVIESLLLPV